MIKVKQVLHTCFKIIMIDEDNNLPSKCNKKQVNYLGE